MAQSTDSDRDAFICHRSTDKDSVVRPLVNLLESSGISCWVDEAEIVWGESLTGKVNEGLRSSQYVIVVLSTSFLDQHWPERELHAALNMEATSGKSIVLPLLVGSRDDHQKILQHYPLLSDKKYMSWPADKGNLVPDMQTLLGMSAASSKNTTRSKSRRIPAPKIKRRPSELDRHRFTKEGYQVLRDYFQEGASLLENANEDVVVTIRDIHSQKFVCDIFVGGERKTKCKIWLGGLTNGEQISYSTSFRQVDDDNSYSDWLTVSRDELAWEIGAFGRSSSNAPSSLNHEDAAQYLWSQYIQPLENW